MSSTGHDQRNRRPPELQVVVARQDTEDKQHKPRRARIYLSAFAAAIVLSVASFILWSEDLRPSHRALLQEADHSEEIPIATPILDAIFQNTPGQSEGYPVGLPRSFAWCDGWYKPAGNIPPPANFTAVTAKGQIYSKEGARAYSRSGGITIRNAKTYVHLRTDGKWVLVQDQTADELVGAHFVADYSAKSSRPMGFNVQSDHSVIIDTPPAGYNDHFWPNKRGTYAAGSVDGVYVQMDMRTNDPNIRVVANVGADWWRDASAEIVNVLGSISGAGLSNWVELSTRWSTLRFYSWDTAQLTAEPPPPLADSPFESTPIIRRRANTPSPCLSRP
jgi:hypothetical protein